jgi:hypothetical protein
LPPLLIGMEACGSAHDWARCFQVHGHDGHCQLVDYPSQLVRYSPLAVPPCISNRNKQSHTRIGNQT